MNWLYLGDLQKELESIEDDREGLRNDIRDAAIKIRALKKEINYIQDDVSNGEFTQGYADDLCEEKQEDILELETDIRNAIENIKDIETDDNYIELKRVVSDIEDYSSDKYTALIPAGKDFEDYVQDLCEDIGWIDKDASSMIVIDWKATAENFSSDFVEIDYEGTTYMMEAR